MRIEDLQALYLFEQLTGEQLGALLAASTELRFAEGDVMWHEGEPAVYWWVLLEGRIELVRRVLHRESAVAAVVERPGDWMGGFRAWSDTAGYFTTGRAASAGRVLRVPVAALLELVAQAFPLGLHLIDGIFQRVRDVEATSRQREALVALGQLAAGLAHELNNPASAAARSVAALRGTSDQLMSSLVELARHSMTAEQFVALDALRREVGPPIAAADSLALADREDALTTWLDDHDVSDAWQIAPALAAAGADVTWCERATEVAPGGLLAPSLVWVASAVTAGSLLTEIQDAMVRITALVGDLRSYTQLDRASQQLIDVTEGLNSTLAMFAYRLHDGITVLRDYGSDVPRIEASAAELNQVWTNLIDNAIDVMGGGGTLRVATHVDGDHVVVEIGDTGPGMPPDVQTRAFDAFFTTKDVGKGTGLGLDISRRIVEERHHGRIEIDSHPGNNVLRVHLPQQQAVAQQS